MDRDQSENSIGTAIQNETTQKLSNSKIRALTLLAEHGRKYIDTRDLIKLFVRAGAEKHEAGDSVILKFNRLSIPIYKRKPNGQHGEMLINEDVMAMANSLLAAQLVLST